MKEYTIRYEETSVAYYTIEAESERKALDEFDRLGYFGLLDYSKLETIKTSAAIIGGDEIDSKTDSPMEKVVGVERPCVEVHSNPEDSHSYGIKERQVV